MIVFDFSNQVVLLHLVHGGALQVGGHHVEGLGPVAAYIERREIQVAFEEKLHERSLLDVRGFGLSRGLRHGDERLVLADNRCLAIRIDADDGRRLYSHISGKGYSQQSDS